jgi:Holliday junction resolvase RusA-like endonuclease
MIEFKIPAVPVPKGRPRMTKSGHIYTPKKTKDAEALIKLYARTYISPTDQPLSMRIRFGMPIPKSYSKAKRLAIQNGELHHTKTPDLDNLLKLVLDGLNGVAYIDDKQIIELSAAKFYAESVGTTVQIRSWADG